MTQFWEIILNWRQLLEIVILFSAIYVVLYYSRKTHGSRMMLVLVVVGAEHLLTPMNLLLYELIWVLPGLLITEWTRSV